MPDNDTAPVEAWVTKYLSARDRIAELKNEYEAAVASAEAEKDEAEKEILEVCRALGLDGMRTAAGTITRNIRTRFWTQDWPELYQTIRDFNAPFLLEQRIHAGNMKEWLGNHPEHAPEGLQTDSRFTITVRKAQTKANEANSDD